MTSAAFQRIARLLGLALVAATAHAQHGHPLVGSWSGEWAPPSGDPERLLVVLEYENDTLSGSIFFGTRRVQLSRAALEPSSWTVRLEAAETRPAGVSNVYLIEGQIENLGSTTERRIVGSLSRNGERGDFRVVLN